MLLLGRGVAHLPACNDAMLGGEQPTATPGKQFVHACSLAAATDNRAVS